jgi:hypothetical protein
LRLLFSGLSLLLLTAGACTRNKVPATGKVNATVIEYKVDYLDSKAGSIPTNILPSKTTLIFADRFALNRIDGFLGQFSLSYIANLKTGSVTTLMKLFDKKYAYKGKPGELPCGINELSELVIKETGRTKEISGHTAKELLVSSREKNSFHIYSLDMNHISNPNITTPYSKVKGVLLEFYTSLSVMEMELSASRIYNREVDWELFNIPDDFKLIQKHEMERAINELFR